MLGGLHHPDKRMNAEKSLAVSGRTKLLTIAIIYIIDQLYNDVDKHAEPRRCLCCVG